MVRNIWISLKKISSCLSSSAFLCPAFRLSHCAHLIVSQAISILILPWTEAAPFHTIHLSKSPLCCQLFLFCLLQVFFLSRTSNSYRPESICPSLSPLDFPTKWKQKSLTIGQSFSSFWPLLSFWSSLRWIKRNHFEILVVSIDAQGLKAVAPFMKAFKVRNSVGRDISWKK